MAEFDGSNMTSRRRNQPAESGGPALDLLCTILFTRTGILQALAVDSAANLIIWWLR